MQKVLLPWQTGILTVALLIACLLLNSRTDAMSIRQVIMKTQPASANSDVRQSNQNKTTVLVRNTGHEAKADRTDAAPAVKPERLEDKKTVGRCWKRLMKNLREIRHAQKEG